MLKKRFVDLSIYLENEVVSDPPAMKPNIDYITHEIGAQQMASFFRGWRVASCPMGRAGRSSLCSCVRIMARTLMRLITFIPP